jgi:hypothetical protein
MNASDAKPVLGLLSRTGPEVPPDVVPPSAPAGSPVRTFVDEPTELLAVIPPPPPRVAARAVIVYEPEPRRSWGLWIFTGLLVALTAGVVLGQTVATQPVSRPAPAVTTWTPPPPPYDAPVGVPFSPPPSQG